MLNFGEKELRFWYIAASIGNGLEHSWPSIVRYLRNKKVL